MEAALEADADDVAAQDDGSIEVLAAPDKYEAVLEAMSGAGFRPDHAEITQRAANEVSVAGDEAERTWKLLETLEDLDDVQHVYSNADFSAEFMQQHSG